MKGCILKLIYLLDVWEVKQENRGLNIAARQSQSQGNIDIDCTHIEMFTKIDAFIVILH